MKKVIIIFLVIAIPFGILTLGFNTQELYGGYNEEGSISGYQFMYAALLLILGVGSPIALVMYLVENWKKL